MEYTVFKVEKKENYAIITFDRPDKFNAANGQIFKELAAAVQEMDADKDVGCMILTGQTFTHPKKGTPFPVFSAGADVEQFATVGQTESGFDFIKLCFEPFKAIEYSETPIIAAVNGAAFGFGFEISGCCDMCFCSKSAKFDLKEINHGALPAWAVTRGLEYFIDGDTVKILHVSNPRLGYEGGRGFRGSGGTFLFGDPLMIPVGIQFGSFAISVVTMGNGMGIF